MAISMTTPKTLGKLSVGSKPASAAGVVNIMVRNPFMISASEGEVVGVVTAGMEPAPKSDAMNLKNAIDLHGEVVHGKMATAASRGHRRLLLLILARALCVRPFSFVQVLVP